jgi:meiosis-specific APC/C activator protein AMA1
MLINVVGDSSNKAASKKVKIRTVPTTPFRVLDAPGLRDDYYCSLIAYSAMTHSLAVGLHSDVYSWNEVNGAQSFDHYSNSHVTSLAFSSPVGGNNILAIGRIDGSLSLWCPAERRPRLDQPHPAGIACVAWSPVITTHSEQATGDPLYTEDLLVGDELGCVHYYTVDWGKYGHRKGLGPREAVVTLIRRISVHTQQICGLAWRQDGKQFATGGNDNAAFLFDTVAVKGRRITSGLDVPDLPEELQGGERYRWQHGAAVKAIAFCPWQKTLLATGKNLVLQQILLLERGANVCRRWIE